MEPKCEHTRACAVIKILKDKVEFPLQSLLRLFRKIELRRRATNFTGLQVVGLGCVFLAGEISNVLISSVDLNTSLPGRVTLVPAHAPVLGNSFCAFAFVACASFVVCCSGCILVLPETLHTVREVHCTGDTFQSYGFLIIDACGLNLTVVVAEVRCLAVHHDG